MSFTHKWAKLALFNFLILASVGLLLRYKILFPLPVVDHKHLMHGHSHFAFAGWVSLALYIAIIYLLQPNEIEKKQFNRLLWIHQISSYGMLFTFPFMGYAAPSIAFSTLSILISYWFTFLVWRKIKNLTTISFEKKWLYAALICNIVSSAGTFALAYMMVNKILHQNWYFGAVYFYLHFQYNGWFLFTILGLLFVYLRKWMNALQIKRSNLFFQLLFITVIPAWFLSMLWMNVPTWMYYAAVAAAVVQLIAIYFFIQILFENRKSILPGLHPMTKWLWIFSGLSFLLKIIMQALSSVQELNKYAFGIRPIVIGFLHLVLLGFVSLFMLGHFFQYRLLFLNKQQAKKGIWIFITGVLLNEFILMLQGIAAMNYSDIPYSNYMLLAAAFIMFSGLFLLFTGQKNNIEPS